MQIQSIISCILSELRSFVHNIALQMDFDMFFFNKIDIFSVPLLKIFLGTIRSKGLVLLSVIAHKV